MTSDSIAKKRVQRRFTLSAGETVIRCPKCGHSHGFDHIYLISMGGQSIDENMVTMGDGVRDKEFGISRPSALMKFPITSA